MRRTTYSPTDLPTAAGGDRVDLSDIPPAVIGGSSVAGMFGGLFWMLATGRLYTRSQHSELMDGKDEQIANRDQQVVMWRAVGETSQAQTVELLEHARLATQLLTAIEARAKASDDWDHR